jgi:glycosyltransferase involved in cell wall biosynthesis
MNRGIETFFRDAFDGLKNTQGLDLRLLKGAGLETQDERVAWSLPRTSLMGRWFGRLARRNGYVIEQWSALPSVVRQIRAFQPQVVFYSDANLGFLLFRFRRHIGAHFRLLFSNGGPVHPPFVRTDFVHQVAPCYHQEALLAGEAANKHFLVPYGINIVKAPKTVSLAERNDLRRRLGLPVDRQVILSVGWIRRVHKRMDYVVEENSRLPEPRPFLQLLGAMDEGSAEIVNLGRRLLGPAGFAANSVPYENVFDYYRAADCFLLASLQEGFGRVYLEALMHGLPVIAHRSPLTEYVLGSQGVLGDLSRAGVLADLIRRVLKKSPDPALSQRRWAFVRDRFSWPILAGSYRQMFQICAGTASLGMVSFRDD